VTGIVLLKGPSDHRDVTSRTVRALHNESFKEQRASADVSKFSHYVILALPIIEI
jgi:hypothetical protein